MPDKVRARRSALKRLRRDRRGATAVAFGLLLPAVVGFAGLGVETGLWYAIKRDNQSAADAGALSGALTIAAGWNQNGAGSAVDPSSVTAMATRAVVQNGFDTAAPNTVVVNNPPLSGSQAGNPGAVEVILTRPQNSLISGLFLGQVQIVTRAVASTTFIGNVCSLALTPTGTGINIQGSPTVSMPNCVIASNSTSTDSVTFQGGNGVTASLDSIFTAGGYTQGGSTNVSFGSAPQTQQSPVDDPYADLTFPTITGSCVAMNLASPVPNLGGAPYCGVSISTQTVAFPPGSYVITGDFKITGGTVTGDGVTFLLSPGTGGKDAISVTGGNINLKAPTSGTYKGVLFFQDPNSTSPQGDSTIVGNGTTIMEGAIYTPSTNVSYSGNTGNCSLVVADTITYTGNTTMDTSGCADVGATPPQVFNTAFNE